MVRYRMIKPGDFKHYCKKVFGEKNCTFTNTVGTSEPYYITCMVENQEVAKLSVYSSDLSTLCRVCLDNREVIVNYNFTLYYYLLKANKILKSVRQKLFNIYRAIDAAFPGENLEDMVKLTIQYLTNVEFISEEKVRGLFKDLFFSTCQNNPKIREKLILDMFEFYAKMVKINKVKEVE